MIEQVWQAVRSRRRTAARGCAAVAVGLLVSVTHLSAQGEADSVAGPAGARPVAEATPVTQQIVLDGVLDEADWERASPITSFTQVDPEEGAPVSEPTEVRILFDDEAVYVGARLVDSRGVSSRLGRRDAGLSDSDWFRVAFDSYRDFRTAYRFAVNPSGVRSDIVLSADGRNDSSWDPIWDVATTVTDSGWVAEMRIPFSQLRFRPAEAQTWGLQLEREIARRQERAVFAFTPKRERGGIARYGTLTGLRGIRPGSRLEVVPYVVGRASYVEVQSSDDVEFADPFRDGSELVTRGGADLKYRVTSNLTLDATVNPDFGQVEADPAEVNLSAFESRFSERRPFFVEGGDIFSFGGGGWGTVNLFYSRRIGRAPQVTGIDGAAYADIPDASTILGAAKLTGKTAGGWSIGVLEAVTQREEARFIDEEGRMGTAVVEPLSNHFVARARRETRQGQTMIGGIVTAVNRRLGEDRLRSALTSAGYAAGFDFRHEWADRSWSVDGYMIGSHVRGSPGVMVMTQRSPARYYHRPDAAHLYVDSTLIALSGYAGRVSLGKPAGEHWRGNVMAAVSSPGIEVNDLGFFYDADRIFVDSDLTYVEDQPGAIFRSWRLTVSPGARWNFGGDFLGASSSLRGFGELLSYWSGNFSVRQTTGGLDDRLTRGGPLSRSPVESSASFEIRSDRRQSVTGSAEASFGRDELGGWSSSFELGLDMKPAPNWSLSLSPDYSRRYSVAQYVSAVTDPLARSTFGRRYLFADLEQTTVSLQTRLNVIFTPGLTFELFARPFLASGDYGSIKELAEPRTLDFRVFGTDVGTVEREEDGVRIDPDGAGPAEPFTVRDRDFRRASLQANAVLRWEWRAGSTLYLVWQQARAARHPDGTFLLGPAVEDLWTERPDNVFLIKMSYWFSR